MEIKLYIGKIGGGGEVGLKNIIFKQKTLDCQVCNVLPDK